MWRVVENSSSVKPEAIDRNLSERYVYVRKDFEEVQNLDQDGKPTGETHWRYLEQKIPVSDWEIYQTAIVADTKSDENAMNIEYIAMMCDVDLDV